MAERVRIKLKSDTHSTSGFRYGIYSESNRAYLLEHDGKEFDATRHNMNYFVLPNGYPVHVYECQELHKL